MILGKIMPDEDFNNMIDKFLKYLNKSNNSNFKVSYFTNKDEKEESKENIEEFIFNPLLLDSQLSPKIIDIFIEQFVEEDILKIYAEIPNDNRNDIQMFFINENCLELTGLTIDGIRYKSRIKLREEIIRETVKSTFTNGILEIIFKKK